jgi:hypothetical protein
LTYLDRSQLKGQRIGHMVMNLLERELSEAEWQALGNGGPLPERLHDAIKSIIEQVERETKDEV